jgi:Flp pilus assembly pilin Flp
MRLFPGTILRHDQGVTMIETMLILASIAPLLIAFSSMMGSYSNSATNAHEQVTAVGESQRILRAITAELVTSCSEIGHGLPTGPSLPHSESQSGTYQSNAHYCQSLLGEQPTMGSLHNTLARNGTEHWYPEWNARRFYIYASNEAFDTIQYQKVRTPLGALQQAISLGDNLQTQWSKMRKIELTPEGEVLLIVRGAVGALDRRVVLGHNAKSLKFHLKTDRHILVRLTMGPSTADPNTNSGAIRTAQITIKPRSGLN